ncbi:MAG: rhodanese-like domain-containing protein [Actinomycetota bacterium]|nr:rhodanese-like domain-containing protein [Actinomycetota bacterium]
MSRTRTVDELLDEARASIRRVTATEAERAAANGALLVDIRPSEQRSRDGTIPGALTIDRNVLEWRLDPVGADRIPQVTSHDEVVIVVCDEGYASSLAASSLQQLGLHLATDVIGGFQAWKAAGLPTDHR